MGNLRAPLEEESRQSLDGPGAPGFPGGARERESPAESGYNRPDMPRLARIFIYPIKSFDGMAVDEARVLPSGALEHDRRFALFDAEGQVLNGKRTPDMHHLRSRFDLEAGRVSLSGGGRSGDFSLTADRGQIEEWLATFSGLPVRLEENATSGFPDDTVAPGPTVVSAATLAEVSSWFDELALEEIRRRFRANLIVDGVDPFWEDRLYSEEGQFVRFQVGDVTFEGVYPCQRCVVPTRGSETGERYHDFTRLFEARRYETLPYWATRSRFDHFYRLAVNTRPVAGATGTIHVGDEVRIVE